MNLNHIYKLASFFLKLANENNSGRLIVVDVQPEYQQNISFNIDDMLDLALNYSEILFLFNGPDLGGVDENELKNFYLEKLDYDEDKYNELMRKSQFFDKGYAFFRDMMDSNLCFLKEDIVKIVKYMINNDINDIRDLSKKDVENINVDDLAVEELEDYGFWIPELQNILPDWNGADILGGHKDECLAEVDILADAMDLQFNHINQFIY